MLAIIMFRNVGDKCYQLEHPEMMTTNVSNYNFQKCWRYMLAIQKCWLQILAIIVPRNAGNNNYNYNF